jgi:hypothetical protein
MTRRFSITLPDDVAEMLDHVDNASAFIAEALRRRDSVERTRTFLTDQGFSITDEGVARMRERFQNQQQRRAARRVAT